MNKLYRSNKNKVFAGVCGGIGEYMDVDPVIIRLIWVLVSIFAGMGILGLIAYIIAALIIPENPVID
ncbi:MAG: PspC domain-containing protein [Patescibacteria group bacterium]